MTRTRTDINGFEQRPALRGAANAVPCTPAS
jgi:hypothetical protein